MKLPVYGSLTRFFSLGILLIGCLVFSRQILLAQDKEKIDSLNQVLETANDKNQISIFFHLIGQYYDIDNKRALAYAEHAFRLSKQGNDSIQFVKAGRIKGLLLRKVGRLNESIHILKEVEPVAFRKGPKDEYKNILNILALSYTFKANYDEALKCNFKALLIQEADGDKADMSITLNNIGIVYFLLNNYEKALEYYQKALQLKQDINDRYGLDRTLINIGLCYNNTSHSQEARKYINRGLKICATNCSEQIKVEALSALGVSFYNENKYDSAEKYFLKSYHLAKNLSDKRYQLQNLINISKIYIKLNRGWEGKNFLIEAESIAYESKYNQLLIQIYSEFAQLYNQAKDFEKAAAYQSKYITLKDSIYSEELIKNLAKVQTDFEERDNLATIASKEEVIKQQRSFNIAIIIIAVLAVMLIGVLYHSNKVKKKVNNALSEAKGIIELKNKELDKKVAEKTLDLEVANQSLIKVNEELDNFIYKTSHDIRGPLASLKGICNVALMDVTDEVAIGYLSKLDITAEHLNTILTRLLIINQINNSFLKPELINFNNIIEEVLALERKKGLPARIHIKKQVDTEIEYYSDREFIRIIFENLIGNAIKFHNDSLRVEPFVDIRVEREDKDVRIRVIDNGIGFGSMEARGEKIFQMFSRASERSTTGGIGLYITKTATEKLKGHVGLRTTSEGYTEFYVKFPIEPVIARFESQFT